MLCQAIFSGQIFCAIYVNNLDRKIFTEKKSFWLEKNRYQEYKRLFWAFGIIRLNLINDNTPPAMASGCIYLYLQIKQIKIDKKQISEVCKISEVTVNKCSKKLEGNDKRSRIWE